MNTIYVYIHIYIHTYMYQALYFGDNDLLLLQFRPGSNSNKNHSEHFRDSK